MGNEEDGLATVAQGADDRICEKSLPYVSVDRRQGVVEDDNVGIVVQRASYVHLLEPVSNITLRIYSWFTHTLLLATTQVDTFLANLQRMDQKLQVKTIIS